MSGPPSLIQEEDEEENSSFHSMSTDMYGFIVPDNEPIVISQIPPTVHRPRIVRRMMMTDAQDTVLSFIDYTTDAIVNTRPEQRKPSEKTRLNQMKAMLRVPSIAFNPFQAKHQEELGFFNKNRLFENSHHQLQQVIRLLKEI
jgi:hypothetical protein